MNPFSIEREIRSFTSWHEVITYFMGYEQHIVEIKFK